MTRLRQMMLEELERRNYDQSTICHYLRWVEQYARFFNVGSAVDLDVTLPLGDACQKLVRNYDPCLSCSVHAVKVHLDRG